MWLNKIHGIGENLTRFTLSVESDFYIGKAFKVGFKVNRAYNNHIIIIVKSVVER